MNLNIVPFVNQAVNPRTHVVILPNNECLPIAHYYDHEGDYCHQSRAVAITFGPDENGNWYSARLDQFYSSPIS